MVPRVPAFTWGSFSSKHSTNVFKKHTQALYILQFKIIVSINLVPDKQFIKAVEACVLLCFLVLIQGKSLESGIQCCDNYLQISVFLIVLYLSYLHVSDH